MKKVLVVALALCVASVVMHAQKRSYYLGPSVVFKGGTNVAEQIEGFESAFTFNGLPDIGLTFRWMFDKNSALGLTLDAEYTTYAFNVRPTEGATDATTTVYKPQYISFAPSLYFSGVTIGVAFGMATSLGVQDGAGNTVEGLFIPTSNDMTTPNVELRLGGQINLVDSEQGLLNLVLRGGYMVTGVLKDEYFQPGNIFGGTDFNPKVVSVGVGINYLFDLQTL